MKTTLTTLALMTFLAGQAVAQKPPGSMARPDQGPPPAMMMRGGPPPMGPHGPGAWWNDPKVRQNLQLSDEQSQKIENISREHQMREIDLRAEVEKRSLHLHQQMEAESADAAQVLAQIDKLFQARGQLEKSQVEMILAIRHVLTAEQAKKLREIAPWAALLGPGFGAPDGPPPFPHEGRMEHSGEGSFE